jgi:aerobic carbon-monoxide dehydrogenase large subunit
VKVDVPPAARRSPEAPDNVAYDWQLGDAAATEAAFASAAHVVRLRAEDNRIIVNSMEPRGAYAEWQDGRLHVCASGQGVWDLKDELVRAFGLPEDRIRVTNPDVGGGFGMKAMAYPEYFVIAEAARQLGRPVRWMSERTEAMLTDNAGRDLVTETELAFDADLRITGYRVNILSNLGAYNSGFGQAIQSELFAKVLTGAYDIKTVHMRARGIYTNTTQVDAYRGAGRPEAIFALERTMDQAARELGVDPVELRLRNFIRSFPYRTASGELYDVGDFPRVLARAQDEADVAGFAARKARRVAGEGPAARAGAVPITSNRSSAIRTEGAAVEFHDDGTVSLFVGTQSNGQGHETVFAAFLSARTGIPVEAIRVVQGDSDRIRPRAAAPAARARSRCSPRDDCHDRRDGRGLHPLLADELGVPEEAITFDDGAFRAEGSNRTLTLSRRRGGARGRAHRSAAARDEARCRAGPIPTARMSARWRSTPRPAMSGWTATRWPTISAC